jgi:hypothetical protein
MADGGMMSTHRTKRGTGACIAKRCDSASSQATILFNHLRFPFFVSRPPSPAQSHLAFPVETRNWHLARKFRVCSLQLSAKRNPSATGSER